MNRLHRPPIIPEEHPRHRLPGLHLQGKGLLPLIPQDIGEFREHGKRQGSAFIVFGRARFQSHGSCLEINLLPSQREDFARRSPAGQIGERHSPSVCLWEMRPHGFKVPPLEKALPGVLDTDNWKRRDNRLPRSFRQLEGPMQIGQLKFHRGGRNLRGQPVGHIAVEGVKRDVTGAPMTKGGRQGLHARFQPSGGPTLIDGILIAQHLHQIIEGRFLQLRSAELPPAHLAKALAQQPHGILLIG
ncbi:MAG: hypothetical protein NW703_12300 [Nitrospiraceae bacterium]|nr:hypothetical protein [Nitrospira tepida]